MLQYLHRNFKGANSAVYIIRNPYMLTYINYQPTYKGLNLVEFGEENNERPFLDTPIHRENYIVHFVLEGNGFFCSNSKKYSLSKGKAFVISRFAEKLLPLPGVPSIKPLGFFSFFRSHKIMLLETAFKP